jgi:hypothetical protein
VGFFDFGAAVDVDRRQSAFLAKITVDNIAIIIRALIKSNYYPIVVQSWNAQPNSSTIIARCTHLALIWEFMASTQGSATWNTFLMDGLRWPASNAIKTLARLDSSRFGRLNRSHVDKSASVTWYFYVMGYKLKSRDALSPDTMPLARALYNIRRKDDDYHQRQQRLIVIAELRLTARMSEWVTSYSQAADGLKAAADYRRCNYGALFNKPSRRSGISWVLTMSINEDLITIRVVDVNLTYSLFVYLLVWKLDAEIANVKYSYEWILVVIATVLY